MIYRLEDIDEISGKLLHNHKILKAYCTKTRGLNHVPKGWGFLPACSIKDDLQKIPASIAIPIKNFNNTIQGYELRALSTLADIRYNKIFTENIVPIYNMLNSRFCNTVVITEGAFDCETIFQNSEMNVVSTVSASMHNYIMHLLAFLYENIILVFDNDKDDTGWEKAKDTQKFFRTNYKDVVNCIVFDIKDYTKEKDISAANKATRKKIISKIEKEYYRWKK